MADVTFHLEKFEGPLDLLLHLISKNKVDILDIPIAEILSQYNSYLQKMEEFDMDITSEFIAMSAHLLLIKSKLLLPKPQEEDAEDPRVELVNMLLEYQKYKEISLYFAEKEEMGRGSYTKPPEPLDFSEEYNRMHEPNELILAFLSIIDKKVEKLPPKVEAFEGIVGTERVTVESRVTFILSMFLKSSRLKFSNLFEHSKNRHEIIATFLAILELCKTNKISTEGDGENLELVIAS